MNREIAVSIICNAYNHEPYIAQCLEGFVIQKTSFCFEVLVHDDASTDKTADIIRMYEGKYPHLIKPIYQTENQYSKGGISKFQYPRVKGKYVAFCEGDDYWMDPYKLQKQFDAMEAHPEVDICAHNAVMLNACTNKKIRNIAPRKKNAIIPTEDVIRGGGGFVATNSLFYRAKLLEDIPPFRKMLGIDYALQIHGALRGGMLYLSDCMSAYRFLVPGSWSARHKNNTVLSKKTGKKFEDMMAQLDYDTSGKYHDLIERHVEFGVLKREGQHRKMLRPRYKESFKLLPRSEQRHIYLKACFPKLFQLWRKLHS